MSSFFDFQQELNPRRKAVAANVATTAPVPAPGSSVAATGPVPLTVSQLTQRIDRAIRAGIPETVHVRGEIGSFKSHQASGHLYFSMKDANTCIECVMWQSDAARLKFTPVAGVEMIAGGTVKVFPKQGKYQLYVTSLRPMGKGALDLAMQQLRAKLAAEGLFERERKKPLPIYPMTVALVTGANTAALQDMLKVFRRFPWMRVLIYGVPVQGDTAAPRIAAAIHHLSQYADDLQLDVIIVGRGGGSLEDLWAFNEEPVARAIAASRVAIVSGIGHEVDTSIADLVADYHAHTPTAAAEIVSAQWRSAADDLNVATLRLTRSMSTRMAAARQRLRSIERHETFRRPMERINSLRQLLDDRQRSLTAAVTQRVHQNRHRIGEIRGRLDRHMPGAIHRLGEQVHAMGRKLSIAMSGRIRKASDRLTRAGAVMAGSHPKHRVALHVQQLTALSDRLQRAERAMLASKLQKVDAMDRQLQAIGPINVLRRGYTMTFRKKDGSILRSPGQIKPGDRLVTRFAEGEAESIAEDPRQPGLFS